MRLCALALLAACRINFDPIAPDAGVAAAAAELCVPHAGVCTFVADAGSSVSVTCEPGLDCIVDCRAAAACDVDCATAPQCIVSCPNNMLAPRTGTNETCP